MRLKTPIRSRGYSLIEQALVLPVLLAAVLAAFDINKALQSYTAIKEAANTSLRCLYTVDGQCVQVQGDERPRFYNYYQTSGALCEYCPLVNYSGLGRHLDLPILSFSNFRAAVLDQVRYDDRGWRWEANKLLYSTEQPASYTLRRAWFPFIEGDAPGQAVLHYKGTSTNYPRATSQGVEQSPRLALNQCSGTQCRLEVPQGTQGPDEESAPWQTLATFSLTPSEEIDFSRPCYRSKPFERPAAQVPNEIDSSHLACTAGWGELGIPGMQGVQELTDKTYIVLWARGTASGTHSGACAKVGLRIRHQNPSPPHQWIRRSLGGQVYVGPEIPRHFYPRGAPLNYIKQEWRGIAEFIEHRNIEILYNPTYEVQFKIFRPSGIPGCTQPLGRIRWTLEDLRIYTPLYRSVSASQTPAIGCTQAAPRSGPGSGFACQPLNYPLEALIPAQARLKQPLVVAGLDSGSPKFVSKAYTEQHAGIRLSQEHGVQDPDNYDFTRRQQVTHVQSRSCPARAQSEEGGSPNYGVPEEPQGGFIRGSQSAQSICRPQATAEMQQYGIQPHDVRWTQQAPEDLPAPPFLWTKQHCQMTPPQKSEFPGELPLYPKLTWAGPSPSGDYAAFYTGPETPGNPVNDPHDPVVIKRDDPLYSCPEIVLRELQYDEPQAPPHSMFSGMHANRDLCDWRSELREDAIQSLEMPPEMYFVPAIQHIAPDCIPEPFPERHQCTFWQVQQGQGQAPKLITGGPFAEGVVPAECQAPGVQCQSRFSHFGPGSAGEIAFSPALAAEHGRRQLQAVLPWSRWNCEGPSCAQIEIDASQGSIISAHSKVEVPMNFLLGRALTLNYTGRERWEGALAR